MIFVKEFFQLFNEIDLTKLFNKISWNWALSYLFVVYLEFMKIWRKHSS